MIKINKFFRKFTEPNDFSKDVVWMLSQTRKDIYLATSKAGKVVYDLMKINKHNVDEAELYRRFKATGPVTVEDIEASLVKGATLRHPLPPPDADPDNPKGGIPCSTCGQNFDAISYKNAEGARRGSVTELKSERFEQLLKDSKDEALPTERREFASRFLKASDDLTTALLKGRKFQNVRLFATCPKDVREERRGRGDEKVIFTYLTIADAVAQATTHDARIAGGKTRSYVKGLKKGLVNFRRPGENRGYDNRNRRGGNFHGGQRRIDDRPRVNVDGASYLRDTAEALLKAKAEGKWVGGLAQLVDASNDRLKSFGIEGSERAYDAVRIIASRTMERQAAESTPVSDSQPAVGATLADSLSAKNLAGLQFPGQKKVARRGKNSGPRQSKADRIKN